MPGMTGKQLAGPAGSSPEDARLAALQSNQADVAAAPTEEDLNPKESLVKALLPLVLAQAADLVATEGMTRLNGQPNTLGGIMHTTELNPLPGMQSGRGRVGWGALETALIGALLAKAPKVGGAARDALIVTHGALARGNNDQAAETQALYTPLAQLLSNQRIWPNGPGSGR